MSWGTYYKHNGYLSRIGKDDIEEEIDECNENIARIEEMFYYVYS